LLVVAQGEGFLETMTVQRGFHLKLQLKSLLGSFGLLAVYELFLNAIE
jgi:hypothetical protein